jgi:hypothetical protein
MTLTQYFGVLEFITGYCFSVYINFSPQYADLRLKALAKRLKISVAFLSKMV